MHLSATPFSKFFSWVKSLLPKGLYQRSLIIIIAPMVLLQGALCYVFFQAHWQKVTSRLSASVAQEVAFLVDLRMSGAGRVDEAWLDQVTRRRIGITVGFQPGGTIPTHYRRSWFSILDTTIRHELDLYIDQPVWFDTRLHYPDVTIRVQLPDGVLEAIVRRSQVYATNWHIFLVWMVVTSSLLLAIAILFLRGQLRPILRLAYVAEAFGKGRDVPNYRPAGASEVRVAAQAIIDMRDRLRRHMEQRTEMLAGVSHDLRTPLTRMKLQLALMKEDPAIRDLMEDIREMEHMLEEYLDFARGQGGEEPQLVDVGELLSEICAGARHKRDTITLNVEGELSTRLRRQAMKRCIANVVDNAMTYGTHVIVRARRGDSTIEINVDDDGPGIPEDLREEAFRPFKRLDESRNPNAAGVGLGLSIARDIVRAHGGDIALMESPLGGLRVALRLPV